MSTLEVSNLDKLVNAVAKSVLEKTDKYSFNKTSDRSILFIIPNTMLGFDDYVDYIKETYKEYIIYFTAEEKTLDGLKIDKDNRIPFEFNHPEFIKAMDQFEKVIVLNPKMELLRSLAETNDKEDINHMILSRLMRSKPVSILINTNGSMMSKIAVVVSDVRKLGIDVINIQQSSEAQLLDMDLILEKDVLKLKDLGINTITLSKKQIVTPLAKDKLREYKISIVYKEELT